MSDDKKLTLTPRAKLGVGKSVEAGQVRQNFSGGRNKTVVVERRKKRVLTKDGAPITQSPVRGSEQTGAGQPTASAGAASQATANKGASSQAGSGTDQGVAKASTAGGQPSSGNAPRASTPRASTSRTANTRPANIRGYTPKKPYAGSGKLTSSETETRMRVLGEAQKRAEEDRKRAEEDKRKAAAEAALRAEVEAEAQKDSEARARAEMEETAKRKSEEADRKKSLDSEEKRLADQKAIKDKAESEARRKSELEARAVELKKASDSRKTDDDSDEERRGKTKKGKDRKVVTPKQPKAVLRGDRRQTGRLTISKALAGDEGARQRSLAAYRRAQAKQRRAAGQIDQAQVRQSREVTVPEAITVQDLSIRMAEKATEVIKTLMKLGVIATINEVLDQDTAELVVNEFGHTMKRVSDSDVEIGLFGADDAGEDLVTRAPIVTIMGHVDHGKTSLLDALRKANVVSGEAGGITQHIGAYQVPLEGSTDKITFLDTPGHAAFTAMRARGAQATDIVVLVVAADDGVMPQTIEAINHAKAAEVPIIVAINKIDREQSNPDKVRQELLQHNLVVESYSGDIQEVEVSALKKTGLKELKEAINLQAELLELKANPNRGAEGVVVEAKLDKGRGPVATVLVQRGTLRVGDIFVAGSEWGKVRALINDHGKQVKMAGPSVPVEVLGLQAAPGAGDEFAVVEQETKAREIAAYRQNLARKKRQASSAAPKTLEGLFTQMREQNDQVNFDVVLKADVQGSVGAIETALTQSGNDDIACRIIHGAVGGITEADITLAHASGALVVGFNVRPNRQARDLAERDGVTIKYYSVIYDLIDDIKAAMAGQLGPEYKENIIGNALIKDVFPAGKAGMAAGCQVTDGVIRNDCKARILREDVIVYEGQINNLRRFKDDVKDVQSGQECGLTFENFNDFKRGDVLQIYLLEEIERKF